MQKQQSSLMNFFKRKAPESPSSQEEPAPKKPKLFLALSDSEEDIPKAKKDLSKDKVNELLEETTVEMTNWDVHQVQKSESDDEIEEVWRLLLS